MFDAVLTTYCNNMENIIMLQREDLEELFKKWASEAQSSPEDELLTSDGLAAYLGYSTEWVRQSTSRVKRGLKSDFPIFFKRGRKLLFRKSDVDAWIEGRQDIKTELSG